MTAHDQQTPPATGAGGADGASRAAVVVGPAQRRLRRRDYAVICGVFGSRRPHRVTVPMRRIFR